MRIVLFTVFFLSLLSPTAAYASTRIALVIGNAAYEDVPALRNPANDARLVSATLQALGFEVDMRIDADRRTMARAIRDFGNRLSLAGDDGVGLFFYAGHGVQARGTNYLLPLNSEVLAEVDLQIEAIDASWVLNQMEEAGNGLNIVILDACRNNPYGGTVRGAERGLARINAPSGSVVAYSAAPGQVALDGDGANSPYAAALTEAMLKPGVELLRVFRETRLAVEAETGGVQTPWEEQSLRSDFYFTPGETDVAAISPDTATDGTQSVPGDERTGGDSGALDTDVEITFWNTVKDSNNPAELQAYIDAFPDGTFVALAELRIARLQSGIDDEELSDGVVDDTEPSLQDQLQKGYLGVRTQPLTEMLAGQLGLENAWGAFVTGIVPGSPAEIAGMRIGDVIVQFNGHDITEDRSFSELTDMTFPGQEVDIHVVRNSEHITLNAALVDLQTIRNLARGEDGEGGQRGGDAGDEAGESEAEAAQQADEWFLIAEKYYYGHGTEQSYEEAIVWYRRAAEVGHAESIYSLGWMYAAGQGVEQDYAEAARWHRRAADLGLAAAQLELGFLYDTGRGVPQDSREALRLYRLAAEGGSARAMGNLAVMLDAGRGTPADPAGAARYLLQSFAAGDQVTQTWLYGNPGNWSEATRRQLQTLLQNAGHYAGVIDGDIGPGTRRALEAYRAAQSG